MSWPAVGFKPWVSQLNPCSYPFCFIQTTPMRLLLSVFLMMALFAGCKTTAEQPPAEEMSVPMEDGIMATVKYIDLEGGFYGIVSDDGESYMPLELADEYKQDGLRVIFKMRPVKGVMTTTMWGKTVEITQIDLLPSDN